MKELLPVFGKRLAQSLLLVLVVLSGVFLARGEGALIPALVLGFAAAIFYGGSTARSLWRVGSGRGGLGIGSTLLRLSLVGLIFLLAALASPRALLVTGGGFCLAYLLMLGQLILLNYRK